MPYIEQIDDIEGQTISKPLDWKSWAKAGALLLGTMGGYLALRATGSLNIMSWWLQRFQPEQQPVADELLFKILTIPSRRLLAGEAPVLVNNTLAIDKGEFTPITKTELAATDVDTAPSLLIFNVDEIYHGQFELVTNPGVALTNFTQQQIWDNEIRFVHDDSITAPFYKISVTDGVSTTSSAAVDVSFYDFVDGQEFQVNTYTNAHQEYPAIAVLQDGKFIITWRSDGQDGSDGGIYAQLYNTNGTKYGTEFQINTHTSGNQVRPAVAGLNDGKFVITWDDYIGINYEISGQLYNADGTKYGPEFQVNTYITDNQMYSWVASLSDGKFVITWQSENQDGSDRGIYGQMYNLGGTTYGNEFRVNNHTMNYQLRPVIAGLNDGKFVIVWYSNLQDGSNNGVYGQLYNTDGTKYGTEFRVNTYTTGDQNVPSVTGLADGRFVVTWRTDNQDGSNAGIYSQIYYANGTKYETEFQVNTYTTNIQVYPSVTGLVNGKFIVTWQSEGQDGSGYGGYAQIYNADRTKYANEFQVNTYTTDSQVYPKVASLNDDKFVVTWHSGCAPTPCVGQDGSGFGIFGQIFVIPNEAPELVNNALTIDEGGQVVLTAINLDATDNEQTADELTFIVTNPEYGQFQLVGLGTVATNFTKSQIIAGEIEFIHDDGELAPTYQISVTDGKLNTFPLPPTVTFTNINDAPILVTNQLTIDEGQTATVTTSDLYAQDPDNDNSTLVYTVSDALHGRFELVSNPGVATTTFSQQQIIDTEVQFVHDGGELAPSYNITVTDGSLSTPPASAVIIFNPVNDIPVLINNNLTLDEGQTVILNTTNLNATDIDNDDSTLIFNISNLQYGQFELVSNPGQAVTNFTQQNVADAAVQFVHDGGEDAPSYDVAVSDGDLSTAPAPATITFNQVNDAPILVNNTLTINEDETVILTTAHLSATDPDNNDASLIYTISNVQHGQFELVSNPGVAITTFTQQQIMDSAVQFVHDYSEQAPSYDVTVSDGSLSSLPTSAMITYNSINEVPILVNNNLTINEGQTVILNNTYLNATDIDNDDSGLLFNISNLQHGQFELVSNPGHTITNFTQQNISDAAVQFVHDGGEDAPSYDIAVSDGDLNTAPVPATITFNQVNDAPTLVNNALTIDEDETVILTTAHLSAIDPDNDDASLIYTISNIQHGQFELVSNPGVAITSFTQQQIEDGAIQFVHDGGEQAPSYDVVVSDGTISSVPTATSVMFSNTVNDAPVLVNNVLTINEGQAVVLTNTNLYATDTDNLENGLIYIPSAVQHGQFELASVPGASINTFTQQQITDGQIVFAHDDSEDAPVYNITVTDGAVSSASQVVGITFTNINDNTPIVAFEISNQQATVGELYSFTFAENTFHDEDRDDVLTYSAKQKNGADLPVWLNFVTANRELYGTPDQNNVGDIYVEITATDLVSHKAATDFVLSVENKNGNVGSEESLSNALKGIIISGAGAVMSGVIGLTFWKLKNCMDDSKRRKHYPLAARVRNHLKLNITDFKAEKGQAFVDAIKVVVDKIKSRGNLSLDIMNSSELDILALQIANAIKENVAMQPLMPCGCGIQGGFFDKIVRITPLKRSNIPIEAIRDCSEQIAEDVLNMRSGSHIKGQDIQLNVV